MAVYESHRYDAAFRLKLSPMLWLTFFYGLRHSLIFVAERMPAITTLFGRWGQLQNHHWLLFSDLLVVAILVVAGQRVAEAGLSTRRFWHRGRHLLLLAFGADLLLFLALRGAPLLTPEEDNFLPALSIVVVDLIILAFLGRSALVRDIFADFPEKDDFERTRHSLTSKNTPETPLTATAVDPESLHQQGLAALEAGQSTEAVILIRKAIDLAPDNALYQRNVGEICRRIGRHSEAIYFGQQATRLAPDDADAHYNLAVALTDLQRRDEAIASYCRVLELKPTHAQGWNNLGVMFRQKGENAAARHAFKQALSIDPDNIEAQGNFAALPPEVPAPTTS